MNSDSIWSNIFNNRRGESKAATAIRNVHIFEQLSKKELAAVEKLVHTRKYDTDETIFNEKDPGGGMYIVMEGNVSIVKNHGGTHEKNLVTLEHGDFFGEIALLDESPRTATAISLGDSKILGFYRTDLYELVERRPKLAIKIIVNLARVVSERLRHSNSQAQELREKLASYDAKQSKDDSSE